MPIRSHELIPGLEGTLHAGERRHPSWSVLKALARYNKAGYSPPWISRTDKGKTMIATLAVNVEWRGLRASSVEAP